MLKTVINWLKALPLASKYLAGACLAILINPRLAVFVSAGVVSYYLYDLGKTLYEAHGKGNDHVN